MRIHEDILDRIETLEVKVAMIEFLLSGEESMITYLDLQQTDDIKENR